MVVFARTALGPFLALILCLSRNTHAQGGQKRQRRKPRQNYQGKEVFYRTHDNETSDDDAFFSTISVDNMTCSYFEQPLNHFDLPRGLSPTYFQRYCTYDDFMVNPAEAPVFFYTGNESPLEAYINNTGLIWELAQDFQAQVIFVEHRYEGKSLPNASIPNCMAYSSSVQALADYANFIERRVFLGDDDDDDNDSSARRPVIAFGGSYGGMLSAWLRIKYPNAVAGAIAGSAPIWGFPRSVPLKIDTAWQVVQRGLEQAFPPTDPEPENNHCASNLLAAWPLISQLAKSTQGMAFLTDTFRLCKPLQDVDALLDWAQSPWFDLAESSFPYPSGYVVYALTHNAQVELPAWPLQAACWNASQLYLDWGVRFDGNVSDVRYNVSFGDSGPVLSVDWDKVTVAETTLSVGSIFDNTAVEGLLSSVRDAVSIWFNITKNVECYDLDAAPSTAQEDVVDETVPMVMQSPLRGYSMDTRRLQSKDDSPADQCREQMKGGSWGALCCNEEMNLIITEAHGLGRDYLWPPSYPRGTITHGDVVAHDASRNGTDYWCKDPQGIFGFPQDTPDPWATWFDTYYGGLSIESASNIVFSNGLLDPWSAAGVYAPGMDPTAPNNQDFASWQQPVPGLYVQNITSTDNNMIALVMAYGGHHTDLMFSSKLDPPSIKQARLIERQYIQLWIDEWKTTREMDLSNNN